MGKFETNIILPNKIKVLQKEKIDEKTGEKKLVNWMLGEGGFGKVYKATREPEKDVKLAVKIVKKYDDQFKKEIEILR